MFFEFNPTNLSGKYVLDATFRAYETWSFNCTPYWVDLERTKYNISENTRWPGPGGTEGMKDTDQMGDRYVSAGRGDLCSPEQPNQWIEFNDNPDEPDENLTTTIRAFADGKMSKLTFMLKAKDESEPRAWKRFDNNAELQVEYVPRPGVPSSVGVIPGTGDKAVCRTSSSDPVAVTVDTPTLKATAQTKVDAKSGEEQGSLQVEFVMERKWGSSWAPDWGGYKPDNGWATDDDPLSITTSKRADGGFYRFKARTQSHWSYQSKSGDLFSSYSSWCYLKIDSTAPKVPRIVSNGPYTECGTVCDPHGGVGVPGKFTFHPNAADNDVKAYRWRLLTTSAGKTKQVNSPSVNAPTEANDVIPVTTGTQVLEVEASDLKLDAEGRVRWGDPAQFKFKVATSDPAVGRWHFDDGAPGSGITTAKDTADGPGSRHDAVLRDEAGTGWSSRARRGDGDYALWLNDSTDPAKQQGYASTNGVPINTGDSFTVSAWAHLTDASSTKVVLAAPGEHASAFTLYYSAAYKKWVFNRTDQDRKDPVYIRSLANTANPPLNVWTHLAGVFDTKSDADKKNDTIQLFINGRPQGEPVRLYDAASTYEPWTSSVNLQIGRSRVNDAYGEYFKGVVDEIAVWQRPLQEDITRGLDEVRQEFRLEQDGMSANALVAHWDAIAATGTEIPEKSRYPVSGLKLSSAGAVLDADKEGAVFNGTSGYASMTGPVIDETGSFTVTARVHVDKYKMEGKPTPYRAQVAGQRLGGESSWALWLEKDDFDNDPSTPPGYLWRFERTAVDGSGKVTQTATVPSADGALLGEDVQVTGVFDAAEKWDYIDPDDSTKNETRFGRIHLYVGPDDQLAEDKFGFTAAVQGSDDLAVGYGTAVGTTGHYLPGELQEIKVWTGAMTANQVPSQVAQPAT
ncbi:LamG domain-containing protein [Streptomyces sp. KR80]|uniref:LamG domain-containing protein n=1 Tax=Streptomyces sp. KR80 TaxID=3457426 RepID=UPI003FCFFBBA